MLKTMSKINQNPHEETTPDFFSGYDRSSSCVLVHVHNESDKLRTKFVSTFFPIAAWIPDLKIYFELALQKIRIIDSHFTVSNNNSLILDISIAPLQVHFYSETLLTTAFIPCRSFTHRNTEGNYEGRTCPRSLCGSWSEIRTCDLPDARHRIYL